MEINTVTLLLAAATSALVTLVAFVLFQNLKKSRYDKENHQALLESIRHSLEKQMYGINDRLVLNEERWRDVNHLLLRKEYMENSSPIRKDRKIYFTEFLKANGITESDLTIDSRLIFILTPFHDKYSEDYSVIREVCTSAGFKCFRGDENYFKGDIFPEMLKLIVKSNLIIANVNGRNPNVLYELGIAQALDKAVILISREPEKLQLPIDIKSKRFLIYNSYIELQQRLRLELINISEKS